MTSDAVGQTADVESLREDVRSDNLGRRWKALSALADAGTPEATEELISAIRDGDEMTAARAANLAKKKQLDSAVPAIIERIGKLSPDTNPNYTSLMLHALAMAPDPGAMPVLTELVASPNRHVRLAAARGLAAIGTPEAHDAVHRASGQLSRFWAWRLESSFARWSGSTRAD